MSTRLLRGGGRGAKWPKWPKRPSIFPATFAAIRGNGPPRAAFVHAAVRRDEAEQGFIAAPEYGQARVTPSPDRSGKTAFSTIPNGRRFMTVSRRAFALGSAALAAIAALPAHAQSTLSADDRAVLARAQAYLQGLTSAQGTFVETSGATRREGRFYLQRPGKMRFEYTNPAGLLVVSDGNNVKRYDPRLNTFRQVPLSQTPLSTFLARTVRLDQGVRIDRVTRMDSGAFAITARDSSHPNEGSVVLAFAGNPIRLQEWTIIDAQGGRTRTQLTTLRPASGLAASLFQLRDPTQRPRRN
jgi:outer membrane lipoprotein-sorting protein